MINEKLSELRQLKKKYIIFRKQYKYLQKNKLKTNF